MDKNTEKILQDLQPDPKLRGKGPVADWYVGKSIFITGASGYMGKVLLEKLLFQCNRIDSIYVLLRSKRGRTPEQRIDDMWKLPVFERLRKYDPTARNKIIPVHGDILSEKLGLSASESNLIIEKVSILFHFAATLKLEAKLKDSIEMNTGGTEKVIALAKQIKNLKVFVHLSTAFCSADLKEFKEKVYHTKENPKDILQVARWICEDALEQATPALIAPHPNTYTYTKRLAENLVAEEYVHLPLVIARPSIVIPAVLEPVPGWVDSLNGPMGLIVGAGKGVIRSMHMKSDSNGQVIPVDVAINALIVIAWKMGTAKVKPAEIPVYNLTNGDRIKTTWIEVVQQGKEIGYQYPFEGCIWYPDGDIHSSKIVHEVNCFFFHWIPAYLIDFLMIIFRQKRFMVRLMRRINDGLNLLQFFTTRDWFFENTNFLSLSSDITPDEQNVYLMNLALIPIPMYMEVALLGARQYLMKEDLSTLPRTRRVQKVLYLIDRLVSIAFYLGIVWIIYSCSDTAKDVFDFIGANLQSFPIIGSLIPLNIEK